MSEAAAPEGFSPGKHLARLVNDPPPEEIRGHVNTLACIAVLLLLALAAGFAGFYVYYYYEAKDRSVTLSDDDAGSSCKPLNLALIDLSKYGPLGSSNVSDFESGFTSSSYWPSLSSIGFNYYPSTVLFQVKVLSPFYLDYMPITRWVVYWNANQQLVFQNADFGTLQVYATIAAGAIVSGSSFDTAMNLTGICAPNNLTQTDCFDTTFNNGVGVKARQPTAAAYTYLLTPALDAVHTTIRANHAPFVCFSREQKSVLELLSLSWSAISFIASVVFVATRKSTGACYVCRTRRHKQQVQMSSANLGTASPRAYAKSKSSLAVSV